MWRVGDSVAAGRHNFHFHADAARNLSPGEEIGLYTVVASGTQKVRLAVRSVLAIALVAFGVLFTQSGVAEDTGAIRQKAEPKKDA